MDGFDMNIFISWSKHKSMEIAKKTKELLESVNLHINAFVSEVDINGGEYVQSEIIEKIKNCDKLVLCYTKENKKSPWLLFEAGYARGLNKTVIPVLFDNDPNWHSWIDNSMNVAREIKFNSVNFPSLLISNFELENSDFTRRKIDNYKELIEDIKDRHKNVDKQCEDFVEKLSNNKAFVCESPYFESKVAHFMTGFESFELYKEIVDSFLNTGKYLWIYGRRNSKLFIGSYRYFFQYLKEKATDFPENMGGIDFRCLFLDPESKEVNKAHMHQNIFKQELEATISKAYGVIGDNVNLKKCFRLYQNHREEIIIRLDNCIIYAYPSFDSDGRPQLLTNASFEVFSADSAKGVQCLQTFENVWGNAKKF
jgi:hypothetical protein